MNIENPMINATIDLRTGRNYFEWAEDEIEEVEEEHECSCGCGYLIETYDKTSFVQSALTDDDEFIINDEEHLKTYLRKQKELLGTSNSI